MVLNPVQVEGLVAFIYTIPIGIAFAITIRHYQRDRSRQSLFFTLAWFSYVIWGLSNAFAFSFNSKFSALLTSFWTIPLAFFTIISKRLNVL